MAGLLLLTMIPRHAQSGEGDEYQTSFKFRICHFFPKRMHNCGMYTLRSGLRLWTTNPKTSVIMSDDIYAHAYSSENRPPLL